MTSAAKVVRLLNLQDTDRAALAGVAEYFGDHSHTSDNDRDDIRDAGNTTLQHGYKPKC